MADNVTFTTPSFAAATDEVTGTLEHVQIMKLAIATDGSRTLIPADATNGMLVDVKRVQGVVAIGDGTDTVSVATAGADGESNTVNRLEVENYAMVFNGTTWDRARGNTTAPFVQGTIAHDTADSGNPQKIGAKAESSTAGVTLVADADRTDLYADLDGLLITKPYTAYGDILVERLSNTDGASTASTVFGATASARNCITTIAVYNSSATNVYIDFRDGTAGTILFTLPLPAYGGSVTNFPLPLRQTTANTAFAYDVSAATTTVFISLIGFKSKA